MANPRGTLEQMADVETDPVELQTGDAVEIARRAYDAYHATCFWHLDPGLVIGAEQLRRHCDREAFRLAARICPKPNFRGRSLGSSVRIVPRTVL